MARGTIQAAGAASEHTRRRPQQPGCTTSRAIMSASTIAAPPMRSSIAETVLWVRLRLHGKGEQGVGERGRVRGAAAANLAGANAAGKANGPQAPAQDKADQRCQQPRHWCCRCHWQRSGCKGGCGGGGGGQDAAAHTVRRHTDHSGAQPAAARHRSRPQCRSRRHRDGGAGGFFWRQMLQRQKPSHSLRPLVRRAGCSRGRATRGPPIPPPHSVRPNARRSTLLTDRETPSPSPCRIRQREQPRRERRARRTRPTPGLLRPTRRRRLRRGIRWRRHQHRRRSLGLLPPPSRPHPLWRVRQLQLQARRMQALQALTAAAFASWRASTRARSSLW